MTPSKQQLQMMLSQLAELKGDTLRLPLPSRFALPPVQMLFSSMFSEAWEYMLAMSRREVSAFEVVEEVISNPKFKAALDRTGESPGSLNSFLISLRHFAVNAPIMTVSEALYDLMGDTKINADIPAKFFTAPFKTVYLEFNESSHRERGKQRVTAVGSPALCEGCYIQEKIFPVLPPVSQVAAEILELDRNKPVRIIDLGFSASPFQNKTLNEGPLTVSYNAIDYCTIYIQDEDEPLKDILDRHYSFFRASNPHFQNLPKAESDLFEAYSHSNFELVTKILFYLHVEKKERRTVKAKSELQDRLSKVAGKKKEKLQKQINRSYDRISIGPLSYTPIKDRFPESKGGGKKAVHVRRGYFGIRWIGTGQAKVATLRKVKETIINEKLIADTPQPIKKNYIIE